MRLKPSETLRAARLLITDVLLWTQHARARDGRGRRCAPNDPRATQWSINGAIGVVSNPYGVTPPYLLRRLDMALIKRNAVQRLFPVAGDEWAGECPETWESCDDFNDTRAHVEVLTLLDTVARELQGAGW